MNSEEQLTLYSKIDLMEKDCEKCGKGYYTETSIQDDWHGLLHCSKCNHEVTRYKEVW
jgi:NAD-dependent SIR2 family protein deacetylase